MSNTSVTTSGGTTAATEQVAIAVDAGLTVSDPSFTDIVSATASITGNFRAAQAASFGKASFGRDHQVRRASAAAEVTASIISTRASARS